MSWALIKSSFVVVILFFLSCTANQAPSRIYLASSLAPLGDTIRDLAGEPVDLVFLSSSAIAKHIEQGAPCEIAVLADEKWRDHLRRRNSITDEIRSIANNSLVLVSNSDDEDLGDDVKNFFHQLPAQEKIVIADPDFVPLGAYTKNALTTLGLYQRLTPQFVHASSARQATVMLEEQAARYAILYRSDAQSAGFNRVVPIHQKHHRAIQYPLVVCRTARRERVQNLKKIFLSEPFKERLREQGFY